MPFFWGGGVVRSIMRYVKNEDGECFQACAFCYILSWRELQYEKSLSTLFLISLYLWRVSYSKYPRYSSQSLKSQIVQ